MPRRKPNSANRKPYLIRLRERKLELELTNLKPLPPKETPLIQPLTEYHFGDYPVLEKIRDRKRQIQVEFTELLELDKLHHQEKMLAAHRTWLTEHMGLADNHGANPPSCQSSAS